LPNTGVVLNIFVN